MACTPRSELIIAFNIVFTPNFATMSNLRLQLVQVTPVVIVALGMAVVVATGGIDLSVGAVMALAAATLAALLDHGPWIAMAAALGAGVLAGAFNGLLVGVVRVQPIVATLGLFIAGRGLALMIADGRLDRDLRPDDPLDRQQAAHRWVADRRARGDRAVAGRRRGRAQHRVRQAVGGDRR